jgi:adenylate kinase
MARVRYFEREVAKISRVVVLECSEAVMVDRLLARKRYDDTEETIRGRLETFKKDTATVTEHFEHQGILFKVDADQPVEEVQRNVELLMDGMAKRRK